MNALGSAPVRRSPARAIAALLADGDLGALSRKVVEKLRRRPLPLPAALKIHGRPQRRPLAAPPREYPLLWMVGSSLRLDGAPLSQFELASGLAKKDISVEVFSPTEGPLRARYEAAGIALTVRPEFVCSPTVPRWYESDVRRLAAFMEKRRPDVLLVSTIDAFPAVDAASLAGIPVIWNIRESEPWRARLADRHPAIAARAIAGLDYCDALVFVADSSSKTWGGFTSSDRSHLIYNAAHPSIMNGVPSEDEKQAIRASLGAGADDILVVSVGTLCPRKGQLDLVQALNLLPASLLTRMRTVFIGGADHLYAQRVGKAVGDAPAAQVQFLGELSNAAKYAAAADILVNTSRSEAFPRTFIEAAAGHTAIIATNVDGAAERLPGGVSAALYEPGDFPALATKLESLTDPGLRSSLASAAHASLIADWTFDQMTTAYERLIRASSNHAPI